MKRWIAVGLAVTAIAYMALMSNGCASGGSGKIVSKAPPYSDKAPDWVKSDVVSWEDQGYIYIRGKALASSDITRGRIRAEYDAIALLTELIANSISREGTSERTGKFIKENIVSYTPKVNIISGVINEWEERYQDIDGTIAYNCWALYRISKADLNREKKWALEMLIETAKRKGEDDIKSDLQKLLESLKLQ